MVTIFSTRHLLRGKIVFYQNSVFLQIFAYLCNGLWLLPLSRKYLIGYFLTILLHQNLAVLTNLKNATDVHLRCYISALCPFGSMCVCIYHPAWAVCVACSDLWAAKALMRDK